MKEEKMDEGMDDEKTKGWEDRGNWQRPGKWVWVKDVYCGKCNHHHYCEGGIREMKANVEGKNKQNEKKVDDEEMNVEEE